MFISWVRSYAVQLKNLRDAINLIVACIATGRSPETGAGRAGVCPGRRSADAHNREWSEH